jgi:vacuolar protein-sorting-associated protein 4
MVDNNMIPKAMELVRDAVKADNEDRLEEALENYKRALNYFLTGLKYMKNEKQKALIREKMGQYMTRAEQIKVALEEKKNPPKKKVVAGGKGKKDDDDDEKDPEAAKLQAALSQAIVSETPNVKWDDVAGLEGAKSLLKEAVILPVKYPELFTHKRTPWRGILLYGPPGTGKSYLAKAVATEAGASCFLSVSSSDLVSKFQGESERLVKNLFELARAKSPAIIFIDEIDSLCGARGDGENESARRIKTEFLVQMQGVGNNNEGILVLGASNIPWELDPAIRRRFEKRVYIPLPDLAAREAMFKLALGDTPNNLQPQDFRQLAQQTEGMSGSDISVMVRDALFEPVRTCQVSTHFRKIPDPSQKFEFLWQPCSPGELDAVKMTLFDVPANRLLPVPVTFRDFQKVLRGAKPTVGPDDLRQLEEWTAMFGLEGS